MKFYEILQTDWWTESKLPDIWLIENEIDICVKDKLNEWICGVYFSANTTWAKKVSFVLFGFIKKCIKFVNILMKW